LCNAVIKQRGKRARKVAASLNSNRRAIMENRPMAYEFEDLQKFGKEQYDAAAAVTNSIAKALQAIATETADYSKKSLESGSAFVEQLFGAKSYDNAIQIQSEYWKTSYAGFIAQATRMGELYSNLAKEAFKPIETAFSKVSNSNN
jgi:hypothetical protein